MMDSITTDLYEMLGVEHQAPLAEIKRAYRKKALTCHPDKNPDNPRAAELFRELSKALEILTDTKARDAYDKVITARKQAAERIKEFDVKRKKLKEDLEAREEAYKKSLDPTYNTKSDEERLKAEIERLQKEGSKQVEEEVAFVQRQIWKQFHGSSEDSNIEDFRIKIRWKAQKDDPTNGGYNYDNLHRIFSKYGDITALVVSSTKKGRAMVEFGNKSAAETALLVEIGLVENPLILRGLWDTKKHSTTTTTKSTNFNSSGQLFSVNTNLKSKISSSLSFAAAPDIFTQQATISDAEFESSVLSNLRRAEKRKQLLEELKAQEGT